MELTPSKRRKTSPSTSVAVTALSEPANQDGRRNSAPRASFLSPTKASLARFNPNLLPRAQSSEPRRTISRKSPSLRTQLSDINNAENGMTNRADIRLGSEPPRGNPTRNGLSAAPWRTSQTPNLQHTPSKQPQMQVTQVAKTLPSRTTGTGMQVSRRLRDKGGFTATNREGRRNGVTIDESSMQKLPHTPTRRGVPTGRGQDDASEPSLPSTPSQLGLEPPPERPKGLLFGPPSKRTNRKGKRGSGPSPLKNQDTPPRQNLVRPSSASSLGPKVFLFDLPKPQPSTEKAELLEKKSRYGIVEKEIIRSSPDVLKGMLLSRWRKAEATEKTRLAKQRKSMANMSNELSRLHGEIEQLGALMDTALDFPVMGALIEQDYGQPSSDGVSSKAAKIAKNLSPFFPFSRLRDPSHGSNSSRTQNETFEPDLAPFSIRIIGTKIHYSGMKPSLTDAEAPHHPEELLQTHDVDFVSSKMEKVANLRLTIDSKTQKLLDVNVGQVELSEHSDLHKWLADNALSKDLCILGSAVGRYLEVAQLRSQCLRSCRKRFDKLVQPAPDHESGNSLEMMTFRRRLVSLTLTWNLALNEDGDLESKVSLRPHFPPAWLKDERALRDELEDVGEAFDLLVRDRGVTEATCIMVNLLFPSI